MAKSTPTNGDVTTTSTKANKGKRPPVAQSSTVAEGTTLAKDLSYEEARTALELSLAKLQASDLPVEEMVDLYQRAKTYAERCEAVLNAVEQTVHLWDSTMPDQPATPYSP